MEERKMKKFTALLLAVLLCLPLLPMAQADTQEEEPVLAGYTRKDAMAYIGDMKWEGFSTTIQEANAVLWLPNFMTRMELPEEATQAGVLKAYGSEYLIVQICLADHGDVTLEDYLEAIPEEGGLNARIEQVNEIDCLIYDREMENAPLCRVVAAKLSDGEFLEILYLAGDESMDSMIEASIATLRFKEGG